MFYYAEFGRSALKGVGIQKNPNNWGALELRCLEIWLAWLLKIHPLPHMCYHTEFGSSAIKGVHINRTEPPKLGPELARLGGGVVDF